VGFDTESKPTFRKGEVSSGAPRRSVREHPNRAYVFMLLPMNAERPRARLIASSALKKVGFGLGDDLLRIRAKMRVEPGNVQDIGTLFAEKGYGGKWGSKWARRWS